MYESIHSGTICPDAGAGITVHRKVFHCGIIRPNIGAGLTAQHAWGQMMLPLSSNILQFIFF